MNVNRLFYLLIGILLLFRFLVLIVFSFQFADHDQVTFWLGAYEMLHGNFYEPCFWGQNYNSMLESLIAVPLVALGMPLHISLPLVTSGMAIFPFIFLAFLFKRNGKEMQAIITLLIPIILTVEFDLITSMPRGWVTGIFVASFGFWSFFNKSSRAGWLLFGFTTVLGLWLNPNSIFLSVFIGVYLLIANWRKSGFYAYLLLGAILPVIWWSYAAWFYKANPSYNFHSDVFAFLNYSLKNIGFAFSRLDIYFKHVSILNPRLGWPLFISLLFLILYLFKLGKQKRAVVLLIIYLGMILMMGMNKIRDAHDTIFFTGARFYLVMPFVFIFTLIPLIISNSWLSKQLLKWGFLIALLSVSLKVILLLVNYASIEKVGKSHWVVVDEVSAIENACGQLQVLSNSLQAELVVFEDDHDQLLNYACPCLNDDFPPTLFPWYERRTWRLMQERNQVHDNILFVRPKSPSMVLDSLYSPERGYHILENNEQTTIEVLRELGRTVRPF
jgi:hypothetical protein